MHMSGGRSVLKRRNCDSCVKKKVKCDGGMPCLLCNRKNIVCVFSLKRKPGPRAREPEEEEAPVYKPMVPERISRRQQVRSPPQQQVTSPPEQVRGVRRPATVPVQQVSTSSPEETGGKGKRAKVERPQRSPITSGPVNMLSTRSTVTRSAAGGRRQLRSPVRSDDHAVVDVRHMPMLSADVLPAPRGRSLSNHPSSSILPSELLNMSSSLPMHKPPPLQQFQQTVARNRIDEGSFRGGIDVVEDSRTRELRSLLMAPDSDLHILPRPPYQHSVPMSDGDMQERSSHYKPPPSLRAPYNGVGMLPLPTPMDHGGSSMHSRETGPLSLHNDSEFYDLPGKARHSSAAPPTHQRIASNDSVRSFHHMQPMHSSSGGGPSAPYNQNDFGMFQPKFWPEEDDAMQNIQGLDDPNFEFDMDFGDDMRDDGEEEEGDQERHYRDRSFEERSFDRVDHDRYQPVPRPHQYQQPYHRQQPSHMHTQSMHTHQHTQPPMRHQPLPQYKSDRDLGGSSTSHGPYREVSSHREI